MKQGILLTAHKEINHLKKIINFFDDDFYLYIHIDKRCRFDSDEIKAIQNTKNVFLSSQFNANWAGVNILKSVLLLAEEATQNRDIEYFHLISGQDFPVKSCDYIKSYLRRNYGREFIKCFSMPSEYWSEEGNGGMNRLYYFHCYELFNARSKIGSLAIRSILKAQRILKVKRNIQPDIPKLFGGWQWWTLTYPCLKYVVDYTNTNPSLLKRLNYTYAADEIYFQTVIMNSPFKANVENNNLRYLNWQHRNGSIPAILDETDYDNIVKSDAFFARKFQYPISQKLISRIENYITT